MRIAVYCSARQNLPADYRQVADVVGRVIGQGSHTLIYGGLSLGLMDTVSKAAKESGARVVGIVPVSRKPFISPTNDETITVTDLNERKARMIILADMFIALPGGYGTLDELMSTIAFMRFTSNHSKPIIVANIGGVFNPLIEQLYRMADLGLMDPSVTNMLHLANTPDECARIIVENAQHEP